MAEAVGSLVTPGQPGTPARRSPRPPRLPAVTWLLIRLRWRMWAQLVRRNTPLLVSTIIGALVGAGLTALGVLVMIWLRRSGDASPAVAIFSMLTLMWTMLSVLAATADSTLEPSRFALLPLRSRQLSIGLLAAALTGIPAILLTVLALASIIAWSVSVPATLAAVVSVILGVPFTVILARVVVGLLAGVMKSRRGRAIGGVLIASMGFLPAMIGVLLAESGAIGRVIDADFTGVATVLGWTPIGWVWAIPFHVAQGQPAIAAALALLTICGLLALTVLYRRQVARALTEPATSIGSQHIRGRSLIDRLARFGPAGVIAARRVLMWRRDSRLVAIASQSVIMPAVLTVQSLILREAWPAQMALIMLGLVSGTTLLNDLAYDGTAWATHIITGVRGWQDRLGRALAALAVYVPILAGLYAVLASIGIVGFSLRWVALVVGALGVGLSTALVIGAASPGQAPRSGTNPFAGTTGSGAQAFASAIADMAISVALFLPIAIAAFMLPDTLWVQTLLLLVTVLYAGGLMTASIVIGGRRMDAKAPEVLEQLRRGEV